MPSAAQVVGVHEPAPQTPGVPPPPHVRPELQLPQLSIPVQPSLTSPHSRPRAEQVVGRQPQRLGAFTPQLEPAEHVPQLSNAAQPSETRPHSALSVAQVPGVQVPVAHTFARPPAPQVFPPEQVPHSSTPPQPSSACPQSSPRALQVVGVHAGAWQRPRAQV